MGAYWPPRDKPFTFDFVEKDKPCVRLVQGISRSGKGETVKHDLIPRMMRRREGVFALDAHDEYSVHGKKRPANTCGPFDIRVPALEFPKWAKQNRNIFLRRDVGVAIAFEGEDDSPSAIAGQFLPCFATLRGRGTCSILFDELGSWAAARSTDDVSKEEEDEMEDRRRRKKLALACERLVAVSTGWLKEGISPWFICQGPSYLPSLVRRQVTEVLSFPLRDEYDLTFTGKLFGHGFREEVEHLEDFHFLMRNLRERVPHFKTTLKPTRTKRAA